MTIGKDANTVTRNLGIAVAAIAAVLAGGCANNDGNSAGVAEPTTAPVSAVAATSAAPADNGVAALSADEILKRAKAAVIRTKSYHLKGSTTDDGQKISMDFKFAGKDLTGTLGMGKADVKLLAVGGQHYMRPNEQFWAANAGKEAKTITQVVGDRWVKVPENDKSLDDMFGFGGINELLTPTGKITKGTRKTVAGVPAIGLIDKGEDGGTLWIATTGEPYPLRLESTGGDAVTISEFGKTFPELKKPATADVLDLAKLQGN
jgi:hypothetical protein